MNGPDTPSLSPAPSGPFLSDVYALRERARAHIEQGPVTEDYPLEPQRAVAILNVALATELVCVLRYRLHYFMAEGMQAGSVAAEFLEHSNEELSHADLLAARIVQLGGEPNFAPDTLSAQSHAEYVRATSLRDMIRENLIAERIAVESYREMIVYFGEDDPVTRRLLEDILATEEKHADELRSLFAQ
ncbi:ferritin-like domain-containing protein [Uliginosibacterium sp. H1]|uniref:ferritin-like domain-containing protein n=1 Tax=Uliginosibacterium sp. H1 TaxID=3114757 RepID=UPI002E17AFFF|nr:ferritin-like domain-containing protein [Uliginosibacterium sp. H1]